MAFVSARANEYVRYYSPDGTVLDRIYVAGEIVDDVHGTRTTQYWIRGGEMQMIPQPDPTNYPLPGGVNAQGEIDPHVLAVRKILAREAARAHAAWMAQIAPAEPVVVRRSPEALAATPPITQAEIEALSEE